MLDTATPPHTNDALPDLHYFESVRRRCGGLMDAKVYQQIYRTAAVASDCCFVEIGTFNGAATTALGRAIKDRGKDAHVFTYDRITGRVPDGIGEADTAPDDIIANWRHFGMDDVVTLIRGNFHERYSRDDISAPVGMLLVDADGCIDRDMLLIAPHIRRRGRGRSCDEHCARPSYATTRRHDRSKKIPFVAHH